MFNLGEEREWDKMECRDSTVPFCPRLVDHKEVETL